MRAIKEMKEQGVSSHGNLESSMFLDRVTNEPFLAMSKEDFEKQLELEKVRQNYLSQEQFENAELVAQMCDFHTTDIYDLAIVALKMMWYKIGHTFRELKLRERPEEFVEAMWETLFAKALTTPEYRDFVGKILTTAGDVSFEELE